MSTFRAPKGGSNVVHRLDIPSVTSRRTRRLIAQRRAEAAALRAAVAREVESVVPQSPVTPAPIPMPPPAPERIVEKVIEVHKGTDGEDAAARKQIELLERRLAKVSQLLEKRDREMSSASRTVDTGVASIYREVQGVDDSESEAEHKKELMSRIFEANLKLRERITSASPDAE